MKKKIALSIVLTVSILLSSIMVMAATDVLQITVDVGQFKILLDGEEQAGEKSNFYWNEENKEFLPLTMVYHDKIYVPIQLLNNNIEYTYNESDNVLSLKTVESKDNVMYNKQKTFNNTIKKTYNQDENVNEFTEYEEDEYTTEEEEDPDDRLRINADEIEFTENDLKFSKFASFQIGADIISKFYSYYGKWVKHSELLNKEDYKITFYDVDDGETLHKFDISAVYDLRTKVVNDVTFIEWKADPTNASFKTFRGIKVGSTINDVIKKYGKKYTTTTIEDDNGYKLTIVTYKFAIESNEIGLYRKGTLSFYTYQDEVLGQSKVSGMRIKINK